MSEIKTNAMRILEKQKISYQTHEYEHGKDAVDGVTVAKMLNQNPKQVFKTLVTKGTSRNYFVFVIPVEQELNLKKAAKAVKEKSVEMIHVSEINAVTGYLRGGCSPIGMKKLYQTVIHESAQNFPTIIVSAGKIGYQIELAPQDLANLIHAHFADIVL